MIQIAQGASFSELSHLVLQLWPTYLDSFSDITDFKVWSQVGYYEFDQVAISQGISLTGTAHFVL